ncbi:hypothetical protein D9619_013502 [Psilocybe cf. subviscida]|uniref:Small secreted protein n=1 Tax=Psilocybe cf. subviscida TaxID=2480587 RepID=A0A8H5F4H0_9AGAR|nr:hypothetical protein D9619_013502 [Psilocybe cf. subviscida]
MIYMHYKRHMDGTSASFFPPFFSPHPSFCSCAAFFWSHPFLSVSHFSPAAMQFPSALVLFFALFATALAAPLREIESRAAAAVFKTTTYNALSISGGKAGNAKAEALAKLSGLNTNDLANVATGDIKFLNSVNQIANDAETKAFNPAIEKASGAAKTALQNGKIKNKVLKLTATVLKLQAQAAQGDDVAEKLATEQKKLNKNIDLDIAAAGQASTALSFNASTK